MLPQHISYRQPASVVTLQCVTERAIRITFPVQCDNLGNNKAICTPLAHLAARENLSPLRHEVHVALSREEHPSHCLDGPCRGAQEKAPGGSSPVPHIPYPSLDGRCGLRVGDLDTVNTALPKVDARLLLLCCCRSTAGPSMVSRFDSNSPLVAYVPWST